MTTSSVNTLIDLVMLLAMLVFIAIWWATKHGGSRGRVAERVREAARLNVTGDAGSDTNEEAASFHVRLTQRLARFGDRLPLFDAEHRDRLKTELRQGGFRNSNAVSVLLAVKFMFGIACAAATVLFGTKVPLVGSNPIFRGLMMVGLFISGMIIPEVILSLRASSRRKYMAACLPDALDLLVICTNAGNSLAVSIRRVAQELTLICPPLSDEFSLTADELQLSGDNVRALNGLAERINLPSIRTLIATLTQAMRYGTPITQSLKTLSRAERIAHIVALEEKAAKLAPKMVLPMMLFVLPGVLAIAAGPAFIQLSHVFSK